MTKMRGYACAAVLLSLAACSGNSIEGDELATEVEDSLESTNDGSTFDLDCSDAEDVKKGSVVDCTGEMVDEATDEGQPVDVTVTFDDDEGRFTAEVKAG